MAASTRPASAADADELARVAALTFPLACPPHVSAESVAAFVAEHLSVDRFREYLADPDHDLLVAQDGDEVVGYAMLVAGEPQDADVRAVVTARPTVLLSKIYVVPAGHGTGTAAELMAAALDAARSRGAASVWLGVNHLNERARRFYLKSGFEVVGSRRFEVGGHLEDDDVFELRVGDR